MLQELRILEQESVLKDQQDTQDRIAAAVLTTGYIADLLPSVFSGLREAGFMVDEIEESKLCSTLCNTMKLLLLF